MKRRIISLVSSPFSLAIILSIVVYFIALFFTSNNASGNYYPIELLGFYQKGFWELLAFAMQMMLILVLGNVLALTPLFQKLISFLLLRLNSAISAVVVTAVFSILFCYLNWGLGLVLSALLAREIGLRFKIQNKRLNYPLVVAAAYSGMMVWHGGLSGSATLKVAENGHFLMEKIGVIPVSDTIFSNMNISLFLIIIISVPLLFYIIAKRSTNDEIAGISVVELSKENQDDRQYIGLFFGIVLIFGVFSSGISNLSINQVNLILFGLGLILYPNLSQFTKAVSSSIGVSTGIMIQFPIYAGIMGLMKYSGLVMLFTNSIIEISTVQTFPFYSFISAAVINFFVPSGGGQWAVQGPILVEAAQNLGVSIPKTIMALAYGDQLTNMIQPFWAIPLLSITGVKAKSIIPYTFMVMLVGAAAFILVLYIF
jgi:short-chain fatty acids transporter